MQGSGFLIYCDVVGGGLAFQSAVTNRTFTIELLTGTWNGTDCVLIVTERGGTLTFTSNTAAQVQLYHSYEKGMRLEYEGLTLTTLEAAHNWNGTLPSSGEVYLRWSFAKTEIYEENFMLWIGLTGLFMFAVCLIWLAWSLKNHGLFSMTKPSIWEVDYIEFIAGGLIIGGGLLVIWLMS